MGFATSSCAGHNRNCARDRVGQGGQAVRQEGRGRQSMMDKALRDRLIADPAISAIVGTRVYWIDRHHSASALPAIVLQKVSTGRTRSDERGVGNARVSKGISRWLRLAKNNKTNNK